MLETPVLTEAQRMSCTLPVVRHLVSVIGTARLHHDGGEQSARPAEVRPWAESERGVGSFGRG